MEVKMNKITKLFLFGAQNEPAQEVDSEYEMDAGYYLNNAVEEGDSYNQAYDSEEISEVKVVTEQPEPEVETVEEEPLYKVVFAPESCFDSAEIVDCFKLGRVVIIDIEALPKEDFYRLFDYIMGAVHALDGEFQKLTKTLVVLWPAGVDTTIDIDSIEDEPYEEYEDEESEENSEA